MIIGFILTFTVLDHFSAKLSHGIQTILRHPVGQADHRPKAEATGYKGHCPPVISCGKCDHAAFLLIR